MSTLAWLAVALGALVALAIVGFVAFTALYARQHHDVEVHGRPGDLTIITPLGKARAHIVLSDEHGRVYMIEYRFRREHGVIYSPPSEVMARNAVNTLVASRMGIRDLDRIRSLR